MPQIRGLGTDYRISKNRRGQVRQATNRITADGHTWERVVVDDRDSLERWLPAVIALRRRRDHAAGRRSHLDDDARLSFYEAVVRDFVTRGRAVIYLLTVDGAVAGYHLTMLDGDTYRMLDGRVADELQRYRGGMVTSMMAMTAASNAAEVTTYDWLRGRTESKFGNHEQHRVVLQAASHRLVTTVDQWEATARRRVKSALPAAAVRRLVAR
nr:GNAT family N-acetyltransferase [Nocardioides thalensis]